MEPKELAAKIVDILDSKKGIDIETIDLTGKTVLADYFVLASGNSTSLWLMKSSMSLRRITTSLRTTSKAAPATSGSSWIIRMSSFMLWAGKSARITTSRSSGRQSAEKAKSNPF